MREMSRIDPTRARVRAGVLRGGFMALALLAFLALNGCEYEEREVEIGYLGEAKRNPFLAAERLCREYGLSAETRLSISDLPSDRTTLILSSDAVASGGSAELIANWVLEGGALIYLLEGGSRFRNDFEESFRFQEEGGSEQEDYLLDYMNVKTAETAEISPTVSFGGESFEVEIPGSTVLEADWAIEGRGQSWDRGQFLEFSYGRGEVYVVSDAHPFRNRQIGEKDHAAFFWSLIHATGNPSVLIVVGGKISFFGLLWSRGWMVVVPVLLALAIWLWKSFPRHGPILPDEELSKRDFSRHVEMLGQFLWRQRAGEALLAPARRRVRLRLRATLGGEDGDSADSDWWNAVAERSGLPVDRIRQALASDPGKEPARFVQISRDLHTLSKSL